MNIPLLTKLVFGTSIANDHKNMAGERTIGVKSFLQKPLTTDKSVLHSIQEYALIAIKSLKDVQNKTSTTSQTPLEKQKEENMKMQGLRLIQIDRYYEKFGWKKPPEMDGWLERVKREKVIIYELSQVRIPKS
jgi:hypothetical protein